MDAVTRPAPTGLLRVLLVTRSFWPQVGGAETFMGRLALGLQARGVSVRLVTAQWHPAWPLEQHWHGVPVTRLRQSPRRVWGTWQYMWGLSRWLSQGVNDADLIYVSMLKHDAYVSLRVCGERVPVVLRAEGGGRGGDAQWQDGHPLGGWIRKQCQHASAVIAPSEQIVQELLLRGYRRDQVHGIRNGVPLPALRTPDTRRRARQALATSNQQIAAIQGVPWVVYTGRLVLNKGLLDLIAAWSLVDQRLPQARLVLVGDGPARGALQQAIQDRGLTESVILPGIFSDTQDWLAAADLFVIPSYEEGLSLALLEALAAELPAVGTDIPGIAEILAPLGPGWLVPPRQPIQLAQAILRWLGQPDLPLSELGLAARQRVADHFALSDVIEEHYQLFRSLIARKRGP